MKNQDKTEEHDFGPNAPRPIVQTAEGFKIDTSKAPAPPASEEMVERCVTAMRQLYEDRRFEGLGGPDYVEVARVVIALLGPALRNEQRGEPVAWIHEISEPAKGTSQLLSFSPDNPWSHWVESHREQCSYNCTPLYRASKEPEV